MVKRAWIPDVPDLKGRASELVAGLLGRAGGPDALAAVPMYRKNDHQRINAKTDPLRPAGLVLAGARVRERRPPKRPV